MVERASVWVRLYVLREAEGGVAFWARRVGGLAEAPTALVMVSEQPVEAAMRLYDELALAAGVGLVAPPFSYRRRGLHADVWHFETEAEGPWPETAGELGWQPYVDPLKSSSSP